MSITSIPIIGSDPLGNFITLVSNSNGSTTGAGFVDTIGRSDATPPSGSNLHAGAWDSISVTSIASNESGEITALGIGKKGGIDSHFAWRLSSGDWKVSHSGIGPTSGNSLAAKGSNFYAADGAYVFAGRFSIESTSSTKGITDGFPTYETFLSQANQMSSGPSAVGYSSSLLGTWVESLGWEHVAGISRLAPTGYFSTSYTFPGASATNYQIVSAIPPLSTDSGYEIVSAIPPTEFVNYSIEDNLYEGYYGLIGSKSGGLGLAGISVSWTE